MSTVSGASPFSRSLRRVHVTKEMLGNQTRKRLLYLDQNVLSAAAKTKRHPWVDEAVERITELLDLQLLAVPYSSTHIAEADLFKERDALVRFIQKFSRGHQFEPYYKVEKTQIAKAFQAFLANRDAAYVREEQDIVASSVHDWDGQYSVSVFTPEEGYQRKLSFKQRSVKTLLTTLDGWQSSSKTFEEDMELEFTEGARIWIEEFAKKTARLYAGDFSALVNAPVSAGIVETLLYIATELKVDAKAISGFFASPHYRQMPSQQLSARLYAAFNQRLRRNADKLPASEGERETKYSGLMFDVEHSATYAPYCDAYFTDRAMANLMEDKRVAVEATYGCKVFSSAKMQQFKEWCDALKASMTPQHADDLTWAYERYRNALAPVKSTK
jgi:hypothetical protein